MGRAGRAGRGAAAGDGIEFVAPRAELFGLAPDVVGDDDPVAAAAFDDTADHRPARWTTAAAGLGVAALLAIGIVAAAPWDDGASAPPTTPVPTTTAAEDRETSSTDGAGSMADGRGARDEAATEAAVAEVVAAAAAGGPPVGYLLDPALLDDVQLLSVDRPTLDTDLGTTRPRGWIDVWATPGANALQGDWLSVELTPWAAPIPSVTATRVPVGDRTGIVWEVGWMAQVLVPFGEHTLTVTSRTWSSDRLVTLAASIEEVNGRPVYAAGGPEGHDLVVSQVSDGGGLELVLDAQAHSTLQYATDGGQFVSIATRPADDPEDEAIVLLVTGPVTGEVFSGPDGRVVRGGRVLTVAQPLSGRSTTVTFTEHGSTVQVTGTLAVDRLLDLAASPSLRPGTTAEWLGLAYDALIDQGPTGAIPWMPGPDENAVSGTLADGSTWTLGRAADGTGLLDLVVTPADPEVPPVASRSIAVLAPNVEVRADALWATVVLPVRTPGSTVRVSPPGGQPVATADLVAVALDGPADDSVDALLGIVRADLLGPWVVEVVDADGRVISTLSSDDLQAPR